jgi:hypothetical protein
MRLTTYFLAIFLSSFARQAVAQCAPDENTIRLEINSDKYPADLSWTLTSEDESTTYGTGTVPDSATHNFIYCVPAGACVKFIIKDSANDGFFPDGYYKLFVNDVLVYTSVTGSFFITETVIFNCSPGTSCSSPVYLTTGSGFTPTNEETWFSFTPIDTGNYVFTTCGAACKTKIWGYETCAGIFLSEIYLGTIFYAESGCPDSSASVSVNLQGGKEYFFRVRYQTIGCSPDSIPYTLAYLGPVIGCMDPLACNYEPLSTISDTCIYPGDPACDKAPDLTIDQELLRSTLEFLDLNNPQVCLVQDGCLRDLGDRQIIHFATHIRNIGNMDYFIGQTPTDINEVTDQFIYDPCHQHWHYLGYAEYLLYNSAGYRLAIGTKAGFCIFDGECSGGGVAKFLCNNMGLSPGCGDVYGPETLCQWIDITGLPADDYTMVVRVNWDQSPDNAGRIEKRFDNNWAQACFNLSYDGNAPEVVFNEDSCKQFTDCLGEVFGSAAPDCNGVCNGVALIGDWNLDTIRNSTDVMEYLNASLADNGTPTACNELHEDNQINVFDAALLQECNLYANDQHHWIQRFPCQFPTGFLNTQDLVTLKPGNLDTIAKTFEIEIANPYHEVMAYEFSVSGLLIESVENLSVEHQVVPAFNPFTGEILALAADESTINKNFTPTPFLRVHYSALTDHEVCISKITAIVNNQYQQSNATLANPNCVPVNYVSVGEPGSASMAVFVQPNPMRESTTVFFENKNAESMSFTLTDLTGRVVQSFSDLRGESVRLEREGLPEGTYLFTLRSSRGSVMGKIVLQ